MGGVELISSGGMKTSGGKSKGSTNGVGAVSDGTEGGEGGVHSAGPRQLVGHPTPTQSQADVDSLD